MRAAQLWYQIRNWRAWWRAFYLGSYVTVDGAVARMLGGVDRITMSGVLNAKIIRASGETLDLGCIGKRVVTTAGANYMRDDFNGALGGADITNINFHDCGTGVAAEAIGNTTLGTPYGGARATGVQTGVTTKEYRSVGTITFSSTLAITEHGIFTASSAGTLWDRTVFAAINVVALDLIQFTYILTINDGT